MCECHILQPASLRVLSLITEASSPLQRTVVSASFSPYNLPCGCMMACARGYDCHLLGSHSCMFDFLPPAMSPTDQTPTTRHSPDPALASRTSSAAPNLLSIPRDIRDCIFSYCGNRLTIVFLTAHPDVAPNYKNVSNQSVRKLLLVCRQIRAEAGSGLNGAPLKLRLRRRKSYHGLRSDLFKLADDISSRPHPPSNASHHHTTGVLLRHRYQIGLPNTCRDARRIRIQQS